LDEAWARWLAAGTGVPRGLTAFLRSAKVREVEDALEVVPIAGPAVERLSDPLVLEEIRDGLEPYLGRRPSVRVSPPETPEGRTARISQDEVRADTLKSLYRKEPRLKTAVEELDLELME
jgi:hypothetical protein